MNKTVSCFCKFSGRQLFHFLKFFGLVDDMLLVVLDPTLLALSLGALLFVFTAEYCLRQYELRLVQIALIDTHVFKLNGYFVEKNPAYFRILNLICHNK